MAMIECSKQFYSYGMGAFIPSGDADRSWIVGADPAPGTEKVVVVRQDSGVTTIRADQSARISPEGVLSIQEDPTDKAVKRLKDLHQSMVELPKDYTDEFMEQVMSCIHLKGNERVLEIGGNIGRNTAVLGQIMKTAGAGGSVTTLETLKDEASQLKKLVERNGFPVKVVNAALSKVELVQSGWNTAPKGADNTEDWEDINTVTLEDLTEEGSFDTLVVDCEGAFEPILDEWPELLEKANVVQIENDFSTTESASKVMNALEKAGFVLVFTRPLKYNVSFPLRHQFYQIFVKKGTEKKVLP